MYAFNFLRMFGQILPIHLSDLDLCSWILTITFLLMISSMVMIGKNLASTIHLLNDSQRLLSTESQLLPKLNQALLQCCGCVLRMACPSLALARLNNILRGAFAHAQNFFCHSFCKTPSSSWHIYVLHNFCVQLLVPTFQQHSEYPFADLK